MSSLLNLIVVLVVANFMHVVFSGDDMLPLKTACIAELNLDPTQYINFRPNANPVPTHDEKCLVRCMLEKRGFISATGEPQVDTIKSKLPATANVDMNKCVSIKTDDACDTAFQMEKCIMDQLPHM